MDDLRTYQNRTSANTGGATPAMKAPSPVMSGDLICPATDAAQTATHTIRRGETLADIARQYGITLDDLLALNPGVNPYYYRAGDVLTIPGLCGATPGQCCCAGRLYCVKAGDTLEMIAEASGVTVEQLLAANYVVTQLGLIAGQIICIPYPCGNLDVCPGAAQQITVQAGQTVADILIAYDISYNALVALNPNVDFSNLMAGQMLCIAERGTHGTCLDCTATYTIGQGETLQSVAQLTGVPVMDLLTMNPTLLPTDFVPGQLICLP